MKTSSKKVVIFLTTFLLLILLTPNYKYVSAEELFSVKPILKSNQVEGIENYVYIKTGGKDLDEVFSYEIKNQTAEIVELTVTPLNAVTSPNGVIQYINGIESNGSFLSDSRYLFTNYVDEIMEIRIGPNEVQRLDIPVKIPNMEGQILGAFGFKTISKGDSVRQGEIKLQINNELNTVLAFMVEFNETDVNNVHIGSPYIETLPTYFAVRLPIKSNLDKVVSDALIEYQVVDSNNKVIFETKDKLSINLAPKSNFDYIIPWDNNKIKLNEEYLIKGQITYSSEVGVKTIPIVQYLKFNKSDIQAESKSFGKFTTEIESNGLNILIYVSVGLLVIAIALIFTTKTLKVRRENKMLRSLLDNGEVSATSIENKELEELDFNQNVKFFYRFENYKFSKQSDLDYFFYLVLDIGIYVLYSFNKEFESILDFDTNEDSVEDINDVTYYGSTGERYAGIYRLDPKSKKLQLIGYCEMKQ